jgi:hypothetical protein
MKEEHVQELLRKLPKEVLVIYLASMIVKHSQYNFIPIIKELFHEIERQNKTED